MAEILSQEEIDALMSSMSSGGLEVADSGRGGLDTAPKSSVASESFSKMKSTSRAESEHNINYLMDIHLDVAIEIGRVSMSLKNIIDFTPGAIFQINRPAGDPVDICVNGNVIAKGEVIVVDEKFGVRLTSLVSPEERVMSLR